MPQFLLSHDERDKILRFASYAFSALGTARKSEHLKKLSEDISTIRIFDRLFDGLPFLLFTKKFCSQKFGKRLDSHDIVEILEYICYAFYYPLEHVAWCSDRSLISPRISPSAWTSCIILWACGLAVSIVKNLLIIFRLSPKEKNYQQKKKMCFCIIFRDSCDFLNAIHFLPSGILWSSKFSPQLSNILGLLSSTVYLFFCYLKRGSSE